ncbi:MAG: metallophosphoesterase family protein [Pseudomonadota bacterium]
MIYAVGDIHGHYDKLRSAHALIESDIEAQGKTATVIHVGDLCDRGPDTRKVIDYLMKGIADGQDWLVLKGNHDQMLLDFVDGGDGSNPKLKSGRTWLDTVMGGRATLASYGAKKSAFETKAAFLRRAQNSLPAAHVEFLRGLPVWVRAEGIIFVHAGIRPGFPIEAQEEDDLLWIRDEFLWHLGDHEALIVHGHTPVDDPTHYGNRVNIDTGAGWGNPLVPVVFEAGRCFALSENGRVELSIPKHASKPIHRR